MRAIDLFAGCGGLTLGLQNAGFKVVLGVDNWQPVVEIYKMNFSHPILNLNLSDVDKSVEILSKYKPDIIAGGPPCQDFSSAGKRNEDLGRADLTVSFAKIVTAVRPGYFIMENVDRIVKSGRYRNAIEVFKKAGYGLTVKTLDASLCGVPQKRKRHFVIGSLNHDDNFLLNYLEKNLSNKFMTLRDYLGNKLRTKHYYRHPRNYNRRGIFSIDEPSPTVRGVNRPIPSGYHGHKRDSTSDLSEVRPLTTKERSFIQTFPENFQLVGSKSDVEQAIGNAVPVKLAEYVGGCLNEFLGREVEPKTAESFKPRIEPLRLDLPIQGFYG